MNPIALFGFIPSAMRDCSTYQFRCTAPCIRRALLSELEFHNKERTFFTKSLSTHLISAQGKFFIAFFYVELVVCKNNFTKDFVFNNTNVINSSIK